MNIILRNTLGSVFMLLYIFRAVLKLCRLKKIEPIPHFSTENKAFFKRMSIKKYIKLILAHVTTITYTTNTYNHINLKLCSF